MVSSPHHVLLVDPDLDLRQLLVEILEEHGYQATGVADVPAAIALAGSNGWCPATAR